VAPPLGIFKGVRAARRERDRGAITDRWREVIGRADGAAQPHGAHEFEVRSLV